MSTQRIQKAFSELLNFSSLQTHYETEQWEILRS